MSEASGSGAGGAGRASVAVSAGLVITALAAAAQAVLLVAILGEGERTDAFLAAYSIYLPAAVFASSLRVTVVPLIGSAGAPAQLREAARELTSRVFVIAIWIGGVLAILALGLGEMAAGDLSESAQDVTVTALLVLALVAVLQVLGAALSAVMAVGGSVAASAALYAVGSISGVAASAGLLAQVGPVGAALGLLCGSVVIAAGHILRLRRMGLPTTICLSAMLAPRRQAQLLVTLLAAASLGVVLQVNLAVAVATVSGFPGTITSYSYAFFIFGILVNMTFQALAVALLPGLVRDVENGGPAAAARFLVESSRYGFAVLAPLLGIWLAFADSFLRDALPWLLSERSLQLVWEVGTIFCVMAVGLGLYYLGSMVLLARRRWRATFAIAVAMVALQAVLTAAVGSRDALTIAWVHTGSVVAGTALILVMGLAAERARTLGLLAKAVTPSLGLAGVFPLAAFALGDEGAGRAAALVLGVVVYLLALRLLWPDVVKRFATILPGT